MSQQINLYQSSLHPKRGWRSLRNLLLVWFGIAACLTLWFGSERQQLAELRNSTAKAEKAVRLLKLAGAQQVKHQSDSQSLSVAKQQRQRLEVEVANLATQAAAHEALLQNPLVRSASQQGIDLTTIMDGLARQRVAGLWLTQFDIHDGGVTLHGAANSAALLPRFAQQLGQEQAFQGHRFDQLSLAPNSKRPDGVLTFSISSSHKLSSDRITANTASNALANDRDNVATAISEIGQ